MDKLENVINELTAFRYWLIHGNLFKLNVKTIDKTIELLKEQKERIKVLEDEETAKNKPMKVVYDMNPMTRLPVSFCPICGYAVDRYAYGRNDLPQVFCPYCGQALDWKDGEQ